MVFSGSLAVACHRDRVRTETTLALRREVEPPTPHVVIRVDGSRVLLEASFAGECVNVTVAQRARAVRSEISPWTITAAAAAAGLGVSILVAGEQMGVEQQVPTGGGLIAAGGVLYLVSKETEGEQRESLPAPSAPSKLPEYCVLAPIPNQRVRVTTALGDFDGETDAMGQMAFEGILAAPVAVQVAGTAAEVEWRR